MNGYGGWHRGYWNGHWGGWGGNWGGYGGRYGYGLGYGAAGLGLGWGLGTWGLGNWPYQYGYSSYSNPYYASAPSYSSSISASPALQGAGTNVWASNDSQPIDTEAADPAQTQVDATVPLFDQARAAFKAGTYDQALRLADQALAKLPNDVDLHEFRALALFAQGRYSGAASALYPVLTAGPGWNWSTLVGLYPDTDTFTRQLRTLESDVEAHPSDAAARFVLAYLYTTTGATDAAAAELKQVVRLSPNDRLSAQLLSALQKNEPGTVATAAASPPASSTPAPAEVAGQWSAQAAQDGSIALKLEKDGRFTWTFTRQGQPQSFEGTYTFGNDLLTLARQDGPPIVGQTTWNGDNRFTFNLAGTTDPGLAFRR